MTFRIIVDDEERTEAMHHALDQTLVERLDADEMQPTLRFWYRENRAVPMGRFQAYEDEVQQGYIDAEGIEVVRRITGGGSMYVEPGSVVTYSMYLPPDMVSDDIEASYRELDRWTIDALRGVGLDVEHEPLNDIVHEDGKIGGDAQLRKSGAVLHHATLSYDLNIENMLKALRIGKEKVSDKAIKSAEKRVAVMRDYVDLDRAEVIGAMRDHFMDVYGGREGTFTEGELDRARQLAEDKFSTEEWNRKL
ncbi:MAG: biotin/lipoate A/B protein ligase family protein [Candidatus Nanohaloarchaea archaeon]|nr:biotin/lipoate A/B protein ligase family protein [Candidatus Nanohaloarchaea archaeon]